MEIRDLEEWISLKNLVEQFSICPMDEKRLFLLKAFLFWSELETSGWAGKDSYM